MTDLPRRSYPLVVPPPGGFEDAVRRGRRVRRRRAGGSSGLALVLVGALGWSMLGTDSGVDRIEPTRDDRRERSLPVWIPPMPESSPAPSAPGNVRPGAVSTQAPGTVTGTRSPASAPAHVSRPPTRDPQGAPPASRRFARRAPIERQRAETNTNPECLSQPDRQWCPSAYADTSRANTEGIYTLTYMLCRAVNAGPATATFDYVQEIEFRARDDANNDTVWTYSAGVPRQPDPETVTVQPGYCVRWTVEWDGYDDYGYTPPAGSYTMWAKPMSRENLPAAEREFTHH